MRLWAKNMSEAHPDHKRFWTIASAIADATIVGLMVYLLFAYSCQICYSTQTGVNTFRTCSNVANIMADGMPSGMKEIYQGNTSVTQYLNNHSALPDWLANTT